MDRKKGIAWKSFSAGAIIAGVIAYSLKPTANPLREETQEEYSLGGILDYLDSHKYHDETILTYILEKERAMSPDTYKTLAEVTKDGMERYPEKLKWSSIDIAKLTIRSDFNKDLFYELETPDFASIFDSYAKRYAGESAENSKRALERISGFFSYITESEQFSEADKFLRENLGDLKERIRGGILEKNEENAQSP